MSQIRESLRLYSEIETKLRAAKGNPLTIGDLLKMPEFGGYKYYRINDYLKQLRKRKLVVQVPVFKPDNKNERFGYVWYEDAIAPAPKAVSTLVPPIIEEPVNVQHTLSQMNIDVSKLQVPKKELHIKVNENNSITITTSKVRITIEVPE